MLAHLKNIDIDKAILENIDIDRAVLENIDIDKEILENIDIDKEISENIDIDKISNRLEFGISNRATSRPQRSFTLPPTSTSAPMEKHGKCPRCVCSPISIPLQPPQSSPPRAAKIPGRKSICSPDVALINACPAHKACRPSLKWHSCTSCPVLAL